MVGQSGGAGSDIEAFPKAAGLPIKDPATLVLVPGTGSSTVVECGDEGSRTLTSSGPARLRPGATSILSTLETVRTTTHLTRSSIRIDEKIASIISVSYGACETALDGFSLEST